MNVNSRKLKRVVSNIILFMVSVILVIGFYWHETFYQLGLLPLVIVGGLATYIVLKVITWSANEFMTISTHPEGTLLVSEEEAKGIIAGSITRLARPLRKGRMRAGTLYDVRTNMFQDPIVRVVITDIRRFRLEKLREGDLPENFKDAQEFREYWKKKHGTDVLRIISFRTLKRII